VSVEHGTNKVPFFSLVLVSMMMTRMIASIMKSGRALSLLHWRRWRLGRVVAVLFGTKSRRMLKPCFFVAEEKVNLISSFFQIKVGRPDINEMVCVLP
jgi:hypothetical protein